MDFGASTSGFEARWCHLIFYLFGIECCYSTKILATATHPISFALGSNIPSVRRREQRFHFRQCRRSSPSFRFVNRSGGTLRRAGWVAFTKTYSRGKWLISHLPPTFKFYARKHGKVTRQWKSTLTLMTSQCAYSYYKEIFCVNIIRCPMWFWKMES